MQKQHHQDALREHWDRIARNGIEPSAAGRYYHRWIEKIFRFLVPKNARVLDLGCGTGDLLSSLEPAQCVGVDLSEGMVEEARRRHPHLTFVNCQIMDFKPEHPFDVIILSDLVGDLWDVQEVLGRIKEWCTPDTRIIINSYSRVWQLPLTLARKVNLARPARPQNWLAKDDVTNLLHLEGFETISTRAEMLLPAPVPLLATLANRYLARLFPFNLLALSYFIVARLPLAHVTEESTVSVVVAARNEEGNVPAIFDRLPQMGGGTELVFVEGGSSDDTYVAAEREIAARPEMDVKLMKQPGKGKGDAVRTGFAAASGDVLMILDADLTVPPEDLPRFFQTLVEGRAEYVNGVRLVYPMNDQAMRFMNLLGNKFFSLAFSWLLERSIKDTLCGTKVMTRAHYERIAANRSYFGDFDPFGDFDLIFGAAKQNLRFIDLPIRYRERTYGDTNISRWRHGALLLRMVLFASRKIKFI